ncbi:MAG: tetratricopeptide repeat protein [Candidatus Gastranaerophilales bacterium]|nr:tetratricopeptide repeat protein [Candidatus Gastranaerophilales bacterium]
MVTAKEYYNKGEELFYEGEYERAIKKFTKAIGLVPEHYVCYYNRALCYEKLEQYEEAIVDYTKSIELYPYQSYAYGYRGDCYKELEHYKEAIADYTKAIELNPDYERIYYDRGGCYRELERYEEAIADCEKVLKLTDNEELKNIVNELIENIKKLEVAKRKLEAAKKESEANKRKLEATKNLVELLNGLKLDLENNEASIGKNDICQKVEKFQEALADYSEKTKILPEILELNQLLDKESLIMKVEALIENKDDEMLETYKKELSELPEPELYLLKAEVYLNKGKIAKALENFLFACIHDETKHSEAKAIIHKKITDINCAVKVEKLLADGLAMSNDSSLSTKEKIEYFKRLMEKEITINTDTISNMYANSKTGRKLDL